MAAALAGEGIPASLCRGWIGELSAWVDGRKVARRPWLAPLSDEAFVAAVRRALGALDSNGTGS